MWNVDDMLKGNRDVETLEEIIYAMNDLHLLEDEQNRMDERLGV